MPVKYITEELAWAAGFFDGEGWVGLNKRSLLVKISQTDPYVLNRFSKAVHLGNITGPYDYGKHSPYWLFQVGNFEHAQQLIVALWNWLSPIKRNQAKKSLVATTEKTKMDKRYLKKLEPIADQIEASYESGMSLAELGKIHNCSPSTVSSLLKSRGVTRRRRGPKKNVN